MKLNQQMLALSCMASMIPLMTGCEKEEQTPTGNEATAYRVPIDSQGRFDEKQAEKNIKQIDFDKNIKLFQKLIDETAKAGRMTDDVWNRFVAVYAKNNVGSEQWIQEAKPFVRAVIENPKVSDMIQDNHTDKAQETKDDRLLMLFCGLIVASSFTAARFSCKNKGVEDLVRIWGAVLAVVGAGWGGYSLHSNQRETVQQAAMNIQKAAYQQTLQQVKQIVAQQDNTAQPAPSKIQGAENQPVKKTIPQYLQENQRS